MRKLYILVFLIGLVGFPLGAGEKTSAEMTLSNLDLPTVERLLNLGNFLIVRENPDGTFKEVSAGTIIDAPVDVVWATLSDFEHYEDFMPQTEEEHVVERVSENELIVEQTVTVIVSVLKVHLTYQHRQNLTPRKRIRFEHVSGELEGTHGGWDIIEVDERRTIAFYSLFSNLMALPWPVGAILKAEPDFMTAVNVTTAMLVAKAVREECEKRAKADTEKQ